MFYLHQGRVYCQWSTQTKYSLEDISECRDNEPPALQEYDYTLPLQSLVDRLLADSGQLGPYHWHLVIDDAWAIENDSVDRIDWGDLALFTVEGMTRWFETYLGVRWCLVCYDRQTVTVDQLAPGMSLNCCALDAAGGQVSSLRLRDTHVTGLPACDLISVVLPELEGPATPAYPTSLQATYLITWLDMDGTISRGPITLCAPVVSLHNCAPDSLSDWTITAEVIICKIYYRDDTDDMLVPPVSWKAAISVVNGQIWSREGEEWSPYRGHPLALGVQVADLDLVHEGQPRYWVSLDRGHLCPSGYRVIVEGDNSLLAERPSRAKSARSYCARSMDGD